MLPRSLSTLLDGLIDYAGLFPPAGLGMADAVARFARYRTSPDAWALGRFVVPVSRLDEFTDQPSSRAAAGPLSWPLTVLASLPIEADLQKVLAFNRDCGERGARCGARIESIEVKATSAEEILRASEQVPGEIELFCEVPASAAIDDLCRAAADARRALKIRTGGTAITDFPPAAVVARFLGACAAARVPFKATAGLHHAYRSTQPVTYEAGAPRALMHGFVNVFVAAGLLLAGQADARTAVQLLEDEMPGSFEFDEDGLGWRGHRLGVEQVAAARQYARSFGSCSFEEPVSEARPSRS